MDFLDGIRAERLISQVMVCGQLDTPACEQTVQKLRALARTAIPKIIALLGTTRREESDFIIRLLSILLNSKTLEYFFEGLSDHDPRVVSGVVKVVQNTKNLDPNRLLDLFGKPSVSKPAILQLLSAHHQGLDANKLLRHSYQLQHNDLVMLYRIINDLADESLVPELINRIDTKDPVMKTEITKTLSRFNTKPVQNTLHRLLEDSNKAVRLAALEGLSQMDAGMDVKQLCMLIKDPDFNVQSKAIDALIKLKHPRTVNYLLDPLQDESEYARRAAVEVLNEIGDVNAIKDLLLAIKDSDWWVRSRAADALGNIGGSKVVESVIELIKDDDEFVRRAAIEIINATQDQGTYDTLIVALEDSDWWVRERAIDGLAALGNKKAVPVLIALMGKEESNSEMMIVVIRALAALNSSSAIEPILQLLEAGSEGVKKEALQALGRLTNEPNAISVKAAIRQMVEFDNDEVRQIAADALVKIGAQYPTKTDLPVMQTGAEFQSLQPKPLNTTAMPDTAPRGVAALTSETVDPSLLKPDDVLASRYRFIKQVGKGAFGTVLLMEDLMINEQVILKFLNAHVASDENIIKRFIYELRFARKITHPNVIRIYDMISFGESAAISMEYFPGHTLGMQLVSGGPMELKPAIHVIREICAGMACAHEANVVHRDLKPGNILINQRKVVKIVDFGVAAATRHMDTQLTRTGLLVGTPTYMAPEQVLGRDVDARTDIYSLGVIMYEMMCGQPPYHGGDSMSVMYQHVQGQTRPPRELNPQLPHVMNAVILKTMATEPEKRFQSMNALRERLDAFVS
ncbi:MAG: protein kinase [Gammaproteobacteria bacterium]|nr:protein kinase [Gammaproteobacteria bacterium]